jgi:hypothetical protein
LVWRVREWGVHRPGLTLKWRGHAASLIRLVPKRWPGGRIAHLLLVLRVVTATPSTLCRKSTTAWSARSLGVALITHIALAGLRRVTAHVSRLVARC